MKTFFGDAAVSAASWPAFERLVARLLVVEGFSYSSVVGRAGDGGADVLGLKRERRWLFQVKRWSEPVGTEVIDRTIAAARSYEADVAVVVAKSGFTSAAFEQQRRLASEGIVIQLWDRAVMAKRAARAPEDPVAIREPERFEPRPYQEDAVRKVLAAWFSKSHASALVVLATGLGKTFVAGEVVRRRVCAEGAVRCLVLAHTNELVYQLERSFWPFLSTSQATVVVNGVERPPWEELSRFDLVFATRDTMAVAARSGVSLPRFDLVVVDECHHLGAESYERVMESLSVGCENGPFLLGLTATPWRPDGDELSQRFGPPVVSIDLVQGLQQGFLSNVDYRMYTDNVDWARLRKLGGRQFSPKAINRTLFINEWDDAVIDRTREVWNEIGNAAKGIVFCGTIEHAEKVAARINSLGFTRADTICSRRSDGTPMLPPERNRLLWQFADGRIGLLCAVDVLNEGVDVPDVNLVVFQRVTHSRRIFVQQLGRGLRVARGKSKVIVLDFVSDIRRFAAGLALQIELRSPVGSRERPARISIGSKVTFRRATDEDLDGANFLREWLGELAEVEEAGEDVSVLKFPPISRLPGSR